MRLMLATQTYDPHVNGQGAFVRHLAEGLASAGHQVLLLMPSDQIRSYQRSMAGVEVLHVRALPFPAPNIYVTMLAGPVVHHTLEAFKPEIVHIHDHYPLCRSVAKWSTRMGLPLVATNNFLPLNMIAEFAGFRLAPRAIERVLWWTVMSVLNQADVVTTPTGTGAEILKQNGLRVPVEAISCGVDLSRFRTVQKQITRGTRSLAALREKVYSRYSLDPARIKFLYVGRIAQEKRLDVLVQALRKLARHDVQLVIAGQGSYSKALAQSCQDLIADGRVVFTGFVPDEDLPRLLASVDVFAMPSEAELQSLATLEAMAVGRPVLAADARALPELVFDGINGRLFAPGDAEAAAEAMADLAGRARRTNGPDRPDLAEMGAVSLGIVREHDLPRTIERYEALYRSVQAPVRNFSVSS